MSIFTVYSVKCVALAIAHERPSFALLALISADAVWTKNHAVQLALMPINEGTRNGHSRQSASHSSMRWPWCWKWEKAEFPSVLLIGRSRIARTKMTNTHCDGVGRSNRVPRTMIWWKSICISLSRWGLCLGVMLTGFVCFACTHTHTRTKYN